MSLINVVIALIIVGVLLWLINTYLPMDGKIKNILNIVVVIAVVLWLLRSFGVFTSFGNLLPNRPRAPTHGTSQAGQRLRPPSLKTYRQGRDPASQWPGP